MPWLGGLFLISYLGDYPDKKTDPVAGKHPRHHLRVGIPRRCSLLSAIVWWLAMHFRLPPDQVATNIEATKAEAAEEDRELAGGH